MPNRELLFIMEPQKHPNWCWAANAASISKYYNHSSMWTQCKVVCSCLNKNDCCGKRIPKSCDIPFYLDDALTATDNFRQMLTGHLPPDPLTNEINRGRIIGARIRWQNGDGHFVSIHGYNNVSNDIFLYIADPIYGKTYLKVTDFATNYQWVGGEWSHTYLTKAPNSMLEFTDINENLLSRARELAPPNLFDKKENFKILNENVQESLVNAMPHDVYVISFNSLREDVRPILNKGGVRLFDKSSDGKNLIFEFSNSGSEAILQQIFSGDTYTDNYKKVLLEIKKDFEKANEVYEIGTVRQPELKVDAIWLHATDSKSADTFIPLFTNEFLLAEKRYDGESFFKLLKENAMKKKNNEDNRLGG